MSNLYYVSLEKNERWDQEMDLIKQYSNLIEEGEVLSKSSCYYPRLSQTAKRGRVAFIELYKNICCQDKERMMSIEDFELFVCKQKAWEVHIQPTDKHGSMCAEWVLETQSDTIVNDYVNQYEYLCTPEMPSINTDEEKTDNVSAIKNLASNLNITSSDGIQIIKYFLAELEQLSVQVGNP